MFELSSEQIGGWVGGFILPFFRIAGLLMTMPIIGTQLVPMRVRIYLSLAFTLVIYPNLPAAQPLDAINVGAVFLIAKEILIGVMLGFVLQLFFHAFVIAGQILATQMGFGFASMVDPTNGVSVAVIGQFYTMMVTLLFLAMNGHLVTFEIMAESFVTMPVGTGLTTNHFWNIATSLGWVLAAGLLLVLPAITALLVVNIAFGVMTRAAPQLNIFSIGFPLTLVMGFVIIWISLSDFLSHYQAMVTDCLQLLRELVQAK
ncbi:flagellar biosynthetic protein FliR [Pseudomonas turukhanskensis]|uniref:Flagellar biosynthetic protein FliR n=1 Tax=Pseudomonas turukhanskensis TaxID=1806536 RepID=A0A9W6KBI2_9PSED|nr:flagellar biosynthetic protein FliR [Pseudomonas turukhanskensis]GLK91574.1 flagellar biosynthetic protein FliR [Pseudomonas turukhanskensis]